ncbi:MAG: LegC family aminotransferase [Candidatus Margulisiibacteriota bacterium]|jgi:aminotransferase in exopolysaccharide biosynthesis
MYKNVIEYIRNLYGTESFIPLHVPKFIGNEKKYLAECIDTTFVSYVGKFVDKFEQMMAELTGAKYAVATVNGTTALHIALLLAGVKQNDEVLTQAVTFVATCNAISYLNAKSIFIDVDLDTLGMSPKSLRSFLNSNAEIKNGVCYNKKTGNKIAACVPVHIFGHPLKIDEIKEICDEFKITLVEDSAESLGSNYKGKSTGTFGKLGIFSFNGNKTVTCGGGGCIVTDDEFLAKRAKYITTTAKIPHKWEYVHDEIGYNYRLTNLNAAVACAQLECLDQFIVNKRETAAEYKRFFDSIGISFFTEPENTFSNYWLNVIILNNKKERDSFLEETNTKGVMTRPLWCLMNKLPMFKDCQTANLENSEWLEDRVVNIPSSVRL